MLLLNHISLLSTIWWHLPYKQSHKSFFLYSWENPPFGELLITQNQEEHSANTLCVLSFTPPFVLSANTVYFLYVHQALGSMTSEIITVKTQLLSASFCKSGTKYQQRPFISIQTNNTRQCCWKTVEFKGGVSVSIIYAASDTELYHFINCF